MKYIKVIVVFIILGICSCYLSLEGQTKTTGNKINRITPNTRYKMQEEFGLKIFNTLKKKDTLAWIELHPTQQEYAKLLQLMLDAKTEGLTQNLIDQMLVQREKESASTFRKEFSRFQHQADSLKINWDNTTFRKFDFIAAPAEKLDVKYLTGNIWFTFGKHQFVIEGIEAIEVWGKYKLQSVKGIRNLGDNE